MEQLRTEDIAQEKKDPRDSPVSKEQIICVVGESGRLYENRVLSTGSVRFGTDTKDQLVSLSGMVETPRLQAKHAI